MKPSENCRELQRRIMEFLFTGSTLTGTLTLSAWNNQLALPPAETFSAGDMEEFLRLSNGYYFVIKRSVDLVYIPGGRIRHDTCALRFFS